MKKAASGVLCMFTILLFLLSFTPYWSKLLAGEDIPILVDRLIDVGLVSAVCLWAWMLGSFFKAGPQKNRVAIGFAMLIFNVLAAPIYWAFYYVREPNT